MSRQYRAPTANGAVLAEPPFDAIPRLVEENRRRLDRDDVTINGVSLRELRAAARREVLNSSLPSPLAGEGGGRPGPPGEGALSDRETAKLFSAPSLTPHPAGEAPATLSRKGRGTEEDAPLLIAGHQPELLHPGVWVKNFALNGLARKVGGIPLNLVVDNDTLKSAAVRFPAFRDRDPASVRLESLSFDTSGGEEPYESRRIEGAGRARAFDSFADRAAPLWSNWGYEPLLPSVWPDAVHHEPTATVGSRFTAMRRARECAWGCCNRELPVSRLAQTSAFGRFARHILNDLPRFRAVYNAAIRAYRKANGVRSANHPAPELADGEAPFWAVGAGGRRARATATSDPRELRPRALTLTLFSRVCLGDLFIHGIGGGKYDEVTDAIIRDYFGIEPPAYQVVSATLHLPLPPFPSSAADLTRAERRLRDLRWNPQRAAGDTDELLAVAREEPPRGSRAERREWFRTLQRVKAQLRERIADQIPEAEAEVRRVRAEVDANAILRRRDYAWVLYPEDVLRPFLQRFLHTAERV